MKKEIPFELAKKLQQYAQELFADMQGDPEYELKTWGDQYQELREQYEQGHISERFINHAVGCGDWETA